ncbi:hypothetical protein GCM10020331_076580 [Ectobacillus funiculus]
MAPKTIAIQKAERITLLFSRPLILFYKVAYPFIWTLNTSARVITGIFGLKPASEHEAAHSEEELRLILSESYESGEINQAEYKYVNNIFLISIIGLLRKSWFRVQKLLVCMQRIQLPSI